MMRQTLSFFSVAALLALLYACDNSAEPVEPDEPPADAETVFDPMQDSIDRAKEAEALVDERKRDLDKQLEELESGKSD